MAVEPWNKINILCPGAAAACRITFNNRTAAVTEDVILQCERVLKLLDSHVLHTEIRVLHEILYVLHNCFKQHKPYRAIKQVEQCINRLKEMKLQEALQDLWELCPSQIQRSVGVEVGQCDVPSQPMLEWFSLKLLGASSLLCRTLDQCTKAFSLTKQHLRLSEFIVLNLVLTSMLSRLWVFIRGILSALVPVYQGVMDLLNEVVQCQPMAFLSDFTLPGDLTVFIGPSYSDLLVGKDTIVPFGIKKTPKRSVIDKLFEKECEEQVEKGNDYEQQMVEMQASEEVTSNMDLGRAILRQGFSSNLDIKTMLRQTSKQCTAEVFLKTSSPGKLSTSSIGVLEQKRLYLKKLKTASSVKDMAARIEEMIAWCRRNKLHQERRYLAFTLLRCKRIKALGCEGISVQKKMRRLRGRIHHVMLEGMSFAKPSQLLQQRTKGDFRTQFITLLTRYGSVRSRSGKICMRSRIAKDLFNVTAKSSPQYRKYTKVLPLQKDVMSGSDVMIREKELSMKVESSLVRSSRVQSDEIDNIFASFGL